MVLDEQHRLCAKLHYFHNGSRIRCNMYHIGGGVGGWVPEYGSSEPLFDHIMSFSLKKKNDTI